MSCWYRLLGSVKLVLEGYKSWWVSQTWLAAPHQSLWCLGFQWSRLLVNLTNCLSGFVSVNSSTYTIYMGKDKYESKFTKAFDFEIAGRWVLFVVLTVFVINFFHFFGKLYLTNNNWPYFLRPYTHCEVVRLEPMALSVTSNIDHSLSVREFNILSSSYFGIDFGNCIYSATEQQMHSSLIIVLPVGRPLP